MKKQCEMDKMIIRMETCVSGHVYYVYTYSLVVAHCIEPFCVLAHLLLYLDSL